MKADMVSSSNKYKFCTGVKNKQYFYSNLLEMPKCCHLMICVSIILDKFEDKVIVMTCKLVPGLVDNLASLVISTLMVGVLVVLVHGSETLGLQLAIMLTIDWLVSHS